MSEMKELTGINIINDFRVKLYSKYLDVSIHRYVDKYCIKHTIKFRE